MPPDPPSFACLRKSDIHVAPLLKILATGLLVVTVTVSYIRLHCSSNYKYYNTVSYHFKGCFDSIWLPQFSFNCLHY